MSYVRLDTGNRWRRQQAPVQNAAAAIKLKFLPVAKLLVHVTGAGGVLRKSSDSGKTWTNAAMLSGASVCLDVCEDADGNIWGLFSASGTAKVALSTNALVSWTLKYTHTAGHQAFNIACSVERATNHTVAFTARDATGADGGTLGDHFEVVVSNDSGGAFSTKAVQYRLTSDQDEPLIQILSGKIQLMLRGRPIVHLPSGWAAVKTWDTRFVPQWGTGHADPGLGGIDERLVPATDRMVVVLHSSSGDPVFMCTNATSTLLGAWDSGTPANFGGDGHAWWRAYYVEPTADHIDMTGTTGVLRFTTFFRNVAPMFSVSRSWVHDLEYHGSMVGTAVEQATASQSTQFGDVLFNWISHYERSIDDITYDKVFHGPFFNDDYSRHNSAFIPFEPDGGAQSSIDWWVDDHDDGDSHANIMTFKGTAVADPMIFPNSVRILVDANTLKLGAIRDATGDPDPSTFVLSSIDGGATWKEEYKNTDFPLPVELTRYGDTSPAFGAVADPNKVIRSTGGTWAVFNDPLAAGGESHNIASLAYDLISDRLFVSYVGSKRIFALLHASVADAAQANSAVDAAVDTLFDGGVAGYWQVIPPTEAAPVTYRQLISHKKTRLP